MNTPIKAPEIITRLAKLYPQARYYLNFSNILELVVATILSAQVKDQVVNATTPKLFAKYKTAKNYARAPLAQFQKMISNIAFYRNKAKNIKEACRMIDEKFKGKIPKTIEELTQLPGIGRKTANAILINGMGIVCGIVVDTHVIRLSQRMGLTKNNDPEKIEKDLISLVPQKQWKEITYWMKEHGRAVCKAPKPLCDQCPLSDLCPKSLS